MTGKRIPHYSIPADLADLAVDLLAPPDRFYHTLEVGMDLGRWLLDRRAASEVDLEAREELGALFHLRVHVDASLPDRLGWVMVATDCDGRATRLVVGRLELDAADVLRRATG